MHGDASRRPAARRTAFPLAAALLASGLAARSASATEVRASLASTRSYGDPVALRVEVVEAEGPGRPALDAVEGMRIRGPFRRGTRTSIVNGVRSESEMWVFEVVPQEERGSYVLGPVRWEPEEGRPVEGPKVRLEVLREPDLGLRFTAEAERSEGVVRWPFRVVYRLSWPEDAFEGLRGLELPVLDLETARVEPVAADPGRSAEKQRLGDTTILVQRTFIRRSDGSGEPGILLGFEVVPLEAGRLSIPPARAQAELRTGRTRIERTFFGPERVAETRAFEAETGEIAYTVRPLPAEGVPPGFTGAVGRYTVEASTDATEVKAYDPIEVEITVKGDGLIEELAAPSWAEVPSLREGFEVSRDVDAGEVVDGARVFRQVLRAKGPEVTEIPPIPFPHYDPEAGRYLNARSEPIPIQVEAARRVGAEDVLRPASADGTEVASEEAPAPAPAMREAAGVGANFARPGRPGGWTDARSVFAAPGFLAALIVPPLGFAMLALVLARMRRGPQERARDRAHAAARSALRAAGTDPDALARACQTYFRERCGLPRGELTPAELEARLREAGVADAAARQAASALDRLLGARFGAVEEGDALARAASEAVEAVERGRARRR